MKIGFIGLGNMGAPMAVNLVKAGFSVGGFDRQSVVVEGVELCQSAVDAVRGVGAVVTMLPNGNILSAVYSEILPTLAPDTLLIDCSTVSVEEARQVAEMARATGCHALDAPVSGGTTGAIAATLTFMVGGDEGAFNRAGPLFAAMGAKHVLCGGNGAGQGVKICNNMLLGISMIGVGEAFSMAEKLGLDAQKLFDVASTSSGSCWSLNTYCPVPGVGPTSPADNDYQPGFAIELMIKDLELAQTAAADSGSATPLGQHALQLYKAGVESALAGQDFSAAIKFLSNLERTEA